MKYEIYSLLGHFMVFYFMNFPLSSSSLAAASDLVFIYSIHRVALLFSLQAKFFIYGSPAVKWLLPLGV